MKQYYPQVATSRNKTIITFQHIVYTNGLNNQSLVYYDLIKRTPFEETAPSDLCTAVMLYQTNHILYAFRSRANMTLEMNRMSE